MTSIEVGVRVRPFNSREIKYHCQLIIQMPTVTSCEVKVGGATSSMPPKVFNLDHCLWTFRDADEGASSAATQGSTAPSPIPFADQLYVYNTIGRRILDNALQGFNACLFAYGQTGSGKTYTMMGTASDPGIIPRLSQDLFDRELMGTTDGGAAEIEPFTLAVEVTYLEIYNESVKDLLNAKGMDKALRVRQHPTFGVYVEGLTKWTVKSDAEVLKLLEDGSSVRSVAATKMNATSSRSHAILTLHIKKRTTQSELASHLHLVDLAGSERASSTGAEGDTLTEGANINRSLSTLGMCLSRLAEQSSGSGKAAGHIPYRDSQLTWLLNDSLGGNSKTAMLANISPASINMEETLSTLRFATTVKKIKNNAVVNEDPQQRLIRELRAEIEDIKKKILALESSSLAAEVAEGAGDGEAEECSLSGGETAPAEIGAVDHSSRATTADAAVAVASTTAPTSKEQEDSECAVPDDEVSVLRTAPSASAEQQRADSVLLDDVAIRADSILLEVNSKPDGSGGAMNASRADSLLLEANNDNSSIATKHREAGGPKDAVRRASVAPLDDDAERTNRPSDEEGQAGGDDDSNANEDSLEHTHQYLLTRLEENANLIMQIAETEEEKESRTLMQERENASALQHLKELQIGVKLNCPRLVTLHEDLHRFPGVALLYYLQEGDTWAGGGGSANPDVDNNSEAQARGGGELPKQPPLILLPAEAASKPTEVFRQHHFCLHVDALRQRVTLSLPPETTTNTRGDDTATDEFDPSGNSAAPAPVFVNGVVVAPGTTRTIDHQDRIVVGLMAYRHSQPPRWVQEGLQDEFERTPTTVPHAVLVEAFSRWEIELASWQGLQALLSTNREHGTLILKGVDEALALVQAAADNALTHLGALESDLTARYPLTHETLMAAAAAAEASKSPNSVVSTTMEIDYRFAMDEVASAARKALEAQMGAEMDKIREATAQRDAEIAALRDELQQQKARKHATARERLQFAEKEGRDVIFDQLYDDTAALVAEWKRDRAALKRRFDEKNRRAVVQAHAVEAETIRSEESTARTALMTEAEENLRRLSQPPLPTAANTISSSTDISAGDGAPTSAAPIVVVKPTKHVDAMLQLAADVRAYEDAYREASLWKPLGPTDPFDAEEYAFSIKPPTLQEVRDFVHRTPNCPFLVGVLHSQVVHKLKRGFLGRLSYHNVFAAVCARFLYYFPDEKPNAVALGAAYLYGAAIERYDASRTSGGGGGSGGAPPFIENRRWTLRIVPSVPRKQTKSSRGSTDENNVVFAFDSERELDSMFALLKRLSMPDCPLNVKQFYAAQQNPGDIVPGVV